MADVLEAEKVNADQQQELSKVEKDTWIFELPPEVCQREGYAEGTMISLTFKNAGIQTSVIRPPSQKLRDVGKQILEEDYRLHEELKRLGD